MRRVALILVMLTFALPAAAQLEFVKAPISIENAVLVQPGVSSDEGVPVPVPVSQTIDLSGHGECQQTPGSLQVSVNQNVLDVTFSATAVQIAGTGPCPVNPILFFDVVMDVPIVGPGPASFVYLVSHASGTFQTLSASFGTTAAFLSLSPNGTGSSTQLPNGRFGAGFGTQSYGWRPPSFSPVLTDNSDVASIKTMFPGDSVRIPFKLDLDMRGVSGDPTQGTISAQFEFRTRFPVPEPSASLSLPLGMAWLAGLSMMRGGA